MSRTWQDNAAEFAALDRGEGWPFARMVACSVERGTRGGDRANNGRSLDSGKVYAPAFAEAAGTSAPRVLRYLDAWDRAAAQGVVPAANSLTPEDAHSLTDPVADWNAFYTGAAGEFRLPEERRDALIRQAEADGVGRGKVQEIANNTRAMAAAIKADPKVALEARKALDQRYADSAKPIAPREPGVADNSDDLIFEFLRLHRGVDRIVQLVNEGKAVVSDGQRDAILREVKWLRTALGYIEDGVASNSLADEIATFLGAQA